VIKYPVTLAELESLVDSESSGWRTEASKRTEANESRGCYVEPPKPNWSRIKQVFVQLQSGKCAYCERKLGKGSHLKVEWDLEHFRPKSAISVWPTAKMKKRGLLFSHNFNLGTASETGYYLLAYDLRNYAVGCKACNSSFKRTYFPVAATRQLNSKDLATIAQEMPLLIFPIGDWGDDPETYLDFDEIVPIPRKTDLVVQRRAQVTIDFFSLGTREELLEERSNLITKLWAIHQAHKGMADPDEIADAQRLIEIHQRIGAPHAACCRSYVALISIDEARAMAMARAANAFLDSKGS